MYHSFFIHSSVDGYLGCFYVLAIINSAAMNIGVHVSLLCFSPDIFFFLSEEWVFWLKSMNKRMGTMSDYP